MRPTTGGSSIRYCPRCPAALCPWFLWFERDRLRRLSFRCLMLRQRIAALITLCCFAAAMMLPGFAAAMPKEDGTISIVICSAGGLKTIEVPQESDEPDVETHLRCDVCQFHCGLGAATQLSGWTIPRSGIVIRTLRPSDLKMTRLVAADQRLPRGPPASVRPRSPRA